MWTVSPLAVGAARREDVDGGVVVVVALQHCAAAAVAAAAAAEVVFPDAAPGAHGAGERLELGAEALSDDAVEDDVDGGVDHEQEVRRAQHHVERHRHVEPVAGKLN